MKNYLNAYDTTIASTKPVVAEILNQKLGRDYEASTLLGLMMGFVPTTDGMMRRIAFEWFREGTLWSLRSQFNPSDPTGNQKEFYAKLYDAFRLRAAPELLWRTACENHTLGTGKYAVEIKKDEKVVLGQISVTHEGIENRDSDAYTYAFGDIVGKTTSEKSQHGCPGRYPALAVISGFLEGLVSYDTFEMRAGPSPLTVVIQGVTVSSKARTPEFDLEKFKDILNAKVDFSLEDNVTSFFQKHTLDKYDISKTINVFAIGDSWVWQSKEYRTFGLHNFSETLTEYQFSFFSSEPKYPEPDYPYSLDGKNDGTPVFNYKGFQLSDLLIRKDLFAQRMIDLKNDNLEIDVILLSCGGNDLANYKNKITDRTDHTSSNLYKILKERVTNIDDAFEAMQYRTFFDKLIIDYAAVLEMILKNSNAKIFLHGYDYPIPDNSSPPLTKAWLKPVFELKFIEKPIALKIMRKLIDELNIRLEALIATFLAQYPNRIHFVDLRGILEKQSGFKKPVTDADFASPRSGYAKYWWNELHPTAEGYSIMTDKLLETMATAGIIKFKNP